MAKVINTLYWVVHPAYVVPWKRSMRPQSFASAKRYVDEVLVPLVKRVQGDLGAVVVFVPTDFNGLEKNLFSEKLVESKRVARAKTIEQEFFFFAKRMLKKRVICAQGTSDIDVAREVKKELSSRELVINEGVKVESYGALWERCARVYPRTFLSQYTTKGAEALIRADSKTALEMGSKKKPAYKKSFSVSVLSLIEARQQVFERHVAREMRNFFRVPEATSISKWYRAKKSVGWKARRTVGRKRK